MRSATVCHLTLLDFGTPRDDKRRQYILRRIEECEAEIELNTLTIKKLREDLARLGRKR